MSTSMRSIEVPAQVQNKLRDVRRRETRLKFLSGATSALAAFLAVMMAAMLVDWLFTLFSTPLRTILTLIALATGALLLLVWGLRPLISRFHATDVARDVDEAIPQLEERWSTVTELSETLDPPEIRGADAMIRQVTLEAAALEHQVTPEAVATTEKVQKSLYVLGGISAALLLAMLVNWQQTSVLLQRFWLPAADISMTKVTSVTGDTVIGEGESLHLEAVVENLPQASAVLFVRDSQGNSQEPLTLLPSKKNENSFEQDWAVVEESFEYRVRSGDGQTPWHSVTVVERPRITAIDFRITPPAYSNLAPIAQQGLPRKVRALEESRLEVSFQASTALSSFELMLDKERSVTLSANEAGVYSYSALLTEPLTLSPILTSEFKLTNETPPTCRITVYHDRAPKVKITTPDDEIAIRSDDSLKVEFTAQDDFGITKAELVVYEGHGR